MTLPLAAVLAADEYVNKPLYRTPKQPEVPGHASVYVCVRATAGVDHDVRDLGEAFDPTLRRVRSHVVIGLKLPNLSVPVRVTLGENLRRSDEMDVNYARAKGPANPFYLLGDARRIYEDRDLPAALKVHAKEPAQPTCPCASGRVDPRPSEELRAPPRCQASFG